MRRQIHLGSLLLWTLLLVAFTGAGAATGAGTNLYANGGFEGSLSGWKSSNASLSLVEGAAGANAARATRTSGSTFGILPSPRPVTSTVAGKTYVANAWVRSSRPGKTTCLRIRELTSAAATVAQAQRCVTATSTWQQLGEVSYTVRSSGGLLESYVTQSNAISGDVFDVDEMTLVDTSAAPPPPADTTPPDTTITKAPPSSTTATSATFEFTSNESGSTFACSRDGAPFSACTSPTSYSALLTGTHTFSVRATDPAGNTDPTPATHTWTITSGNDATPPETYIASGPNGTTRTNSPVFGFSSDESGVTYECSVDDAAFTPCAATHTVHIASGLHTLQVRAKDAAGNVDLSPAARSWWSDGLLQNGNFEIADATGWARQSSFQLAGWKGYQASLTRIASGGPAGPGAARVTATSTSSYSVYSSPKPVNSTTAGTVYTARGWARSDVAGKTLCLHVREFSGGTAIASARSCITATTSWQQFAPVSYTASASGNEIEVYVSQSTASSTGDSFDVDGISLADGAADPVLPAESGDPTILALADMASCWSSGDEAVSRLLDTTAGIIAPAGDTEQNFGTKEEFEQCYEPTFGRHKWRTRPGIGDHEYRTHADAHPYFDYFGAAAGPYLKGWYSYDLGSWHVVVLNSIKCTGTGGGCGPGTEQYEWLKADLAANAKDCTAAVMHHPRYSNGSIHGNQTFVQPLWELLYQYRTDFTYGGNDHTYQRWAPQDPHGNAVPDGIRQFVVGTGGTQHYALKTGMPANLQVQHSGTFGVTRFVLRPGSYEWTFLPQAGKTFTDSGSTACSPLPGGGDTTAPDTSITKAPAASTTATDATFEFASTESGSTFQCSLDGGAWTACISPKTYTALTVGAHTFDVRATDAAGNTDASPARHTWTVQAPGDTTPPDTSITKGPASPTTATDATFEFASTETGSTFQCSLDGGAYSACASPKTYTGLAPGGHSFAVKATDGAGNTDPTPATWSWTVESAPPPPPPPPPSSNLIANGSFEGSVSGWAGYRATLSLITGGAVGDQAARVALNTTGTSFTIYTAPKPVTSTVAGAYKAQAWLRAPAGKTICLRVREWDGSTIVGGPQTCLTANGSWQQTPVLSHTPAAGRQLEVYAFLNNSVSGDWFDIDGVTLTAP